MTDPNRLLLYWPPAAHDLRDQAEAAAAAQSEREHRAVSVSEWIREAVWQRLEREKRENGSGG